MLAGGRSTRFGADKLAAEYRGLPLLHHPILRLAEVCEDVVAVLAPGAGASLPSGARATHDPVGGEGPLSGLGQGLSEVSASERVVVAGGDMPDLRVPVLREMLRMLDAVATDAVALHDGERARPLPCVLRTQPALRIVPSLLERGRRRLRDVLDTMDTTVIGDPAWTTLDPERRTLFDVDVPGDLRR